MLKRENYQSMLKASFRQMISLLLSVALYTSGSIAAAQSAQTSQPRTSYGYFNIRQYCQAEDGEYHHYSFITNIFASSSNKDQGRASNEAQAAFFKMVKAQEWTCLNEGTPEFYRVSTLTSAQSQRDARIRYESSAHVNLYEYNYSDGAQEGTLPTLLHEED